MVNILIQTDTRYPVNRKIIRKAIADVFVSQKIADIDTEISMSVVGARKMRFLTREFLSEDRPHEVLAFGLQDTTSSVKETGGQAIGFVDVPDGILHLGDVILCWPEVLRSASARDVFVDDELYRLVVHGAEHLLGKHHEWLGNQAIC